MGEGMNKIAQLTKNQNSISETLLPALFNIFERWGLTGKQQMILLGLTNEKTLYNWKNTPSKAQLSKDLIERASYILGIYKSLEILFENPSLADKWLSSQNDNRLFNGKAPLSRLLSGYVTDLAVVRNHLDSVRG